MTPDELPQRAGVALRSRSKSRENAAHGHDGPNSFEFLGVPATNGNGRPKWLGDTHPLWVQQRNMHYSRRSWGPRRVPNAPMGWPGDCYSIFSVDLALPDLNEHVCMCMMHCIKINDGSIDWLLWWQLHSLAWKVFSKIWFTFSTLRPSPRAT